MPEDRTVHSVAGLIREGDKDRLCVPGNSSQPGHDLLACAHSHLIGSRNMEWKPLFLAGKRIFVSGFWFSLPGPLFCFGFPILTCSHFALSSNASVAVLSSRGGINFGLKMRFLAGLS